MTAGSPPLASVSCWALRYGALQMYSGRGDGHSGLLEEAEWQ